ncbi:MAG: hypothetical protein HOG60_09395 [Gammaproteobacteria bacterium]|jgi:uncharacterized iron-regulated protein|nr:hypothetical protein [Gammaproteobacteria bacterium]
MFLKILLLIFISFSASANTNIPIKPDSITIIGETHRHPESINLFQSLIQSHLKNNQCLTVALEINSNQQSVINQGKVSDIEISSIIDHPAYRKMIADLVTQQRNGACLKLLAIDAGDDIDMGRDEWMAISLARLVGETPVLALLGSLHTLKKVNWDLSMTNGSPSVAEVLSEQGYNVKSYPQVGLDTECGNSLQYRLISAKYT